MIRVCEILFATFATDAEVQADAQQVLDSLRVGHIPVERQNRISVRKISKVAK